MKKKQVFFGTLSILALIAILGGYKFFQIRAAIEMGKNMGPPPDAVTTYTAKKVNWQNRYKVLGTVSPVQGATIKAERAGRIEKIGFDSGSYIKKDDLIVAMNTDVEQAQLNSAKAVLVRTKRDFIRQEGLKRQNATSQLAYDTALSSYDEAKAKVEELKAEIDLKNIYAPFSGYAGIRSVNIGERIDVGDSVVSLQSYESLYINFDLPQSLIGQIAKGVKIEITSEAFPDRKFSGEVHAIDSAISETTRTISVQGKVNNTDNSLRAGMFVQVEVARSSANSYVTVPISAVAYAPYGNSVFVLKEKNKDGMYPLESRIIKTGPKRGDQIAVISGVKKGEQVVSSGVFKLRADSLVLIDNSVAPGSQANPRVGNS